MSYHEGSNWQANKEDKGEKLYQPPMNTQIPAEMRDRIANDAIKIRIQTGSSWCGDYYETGAIQYANQLFAAQERIKQLEDALREIVRKEDARWTTQPDVKSHILSVANEALSPNNKIKEDEKNANP